MAENDDLFQTVGSGDPYFVLFTQFMGHALNVHICRFRFLGVDHRQIAEMTAADWGKLGIKVTINLNNPARFYQKLRKGEVQTFRLSWIGDYPDAENFLQLFYSRNAGGANRAGYNDPEFDAMFEKILTMPDSPERTALYCKMAEDLVMQAPWIFESQPISFQLKHAWLENYQPHDFACNRWKYWSIDHQRKKALKQDFRPLSFKELRQ